MHYAVREPESWRGPIYELITQKNKNWSRNLSQETLQSFERGCVLKGQYAMARAILSAIDQKKTIRVCGDYDADGATSTAVVVACLRSWGANIDYVVPDRMRMGYGLSVALIESCDTPADVWITVDNGISSVDAVEYLKKQNRWVLVTDHHLMPSIPSQPHVCVNPNQDGMPDETRSLAGVGVAWKVMSAVYQGLVSKFPDKIWPRTHELMLPWVALGTICDLVPLSPINCMLVQEGLSRFKKNPDQYPGLKALCQLRSIKTDTLNETDIGFIIGPCINAAGRLDSMSAGIETMLESNPTQALNRAQLLVQINEERKRTTLEGTDHAESMIASMLSSLETQEKPPVYVLFDEQGHHGVVGLVASRIKEKYHRPAFVFAPDDMNPEHIRGSARSISGVHIRDILASIQSRHPDWIVRFGGHAMAAGLTLNRFYLDAFRDELGQMIQSMSNVSDTLKDQVLVDWWMQPDHLHLRTLDFMQKLQPFGQGRPQPQWMAEWMVQSIRVLKDKHVKALVRLSHSHGRQDSQEVTLLHFNADLAAWDEAWRHNQPILTVCSLNKNEFNGMTQLQIMVDRVVGEQDTLDEIFRPFLPRYFGQEIEKPLMDLQSLPVPVLI